MVLQCGHVEVHLTHSQHLLALGTFHLDVTGFKVLTQANLEEIKNGQKSNKFTFCSSIAVNLKMIMGLNFQILKRLCFGNACQELSFSNLVGLIFQRISVFNF